MQRLPLAAGPIRLIITLSAVYVMATFSAPAAQAHEGSAVLDIEAVEAEPLRIELRVRVRYSNDNEPASGAILTAIGAGPKGDTAHEVSLDREGEGLYTGTLEVPAAGRWNVDIASAFPPGSGSVTVEVTGEADPDGSGGVVLVATTVGVLLFAGTTWVLLRRRRGSRWPAEPPAAGS